MNKHLCFTVMLLMTFVAAFAQTQITGKVVDAATHQSLQGATITDLQNNLHRVADINGNFSLPQKLENSSTTRQFKRLLEFNCKGKLENNF